MCVQELGSFIASHSARTAVTLLPLPPLPPTSSELESELYMQCLDALTADLPPTVLISKGEPMEVLSFDI